MTAESPEQTTARYLAEACHELRTPVAVLSLVTELGDRADQLDRARFEALMSTVREQTAVLRTLIDRYLEHAVLIDDGWTDDAVDFDVAEAVGATLDSFASLVPSERLDRRLAPAHVVGDPRRVRGVVANLVLNAVRYSLASEPIDVEVARDGPVVTLRVLDRGIGVPIEERTQIMEPFQRGTNAQDQAVPGLGLGLAIVATHVAALDGRVDVSDRPGGGTVVTVTLPGSGG